MLFTLWSSYQGELLSSGQIKFLANIGLESGRCDYNRPKEHILAHSSLVRREFPFDETNYLLTIWRNCS